MGCWNTGTHAQRLHFIDQDGGCEGMHKYMALLELALALGRMLVCSMGSTG